MIATTTLLLLFILSFLSPSPIPVPTDVVALSAFFLKINIFSILIVLVVGHLLGLLVFYGLGYMSGKIIKKWEKKRKDKIYKFAERAYKKYGVYTLLFCSVRFIGKPLVLAAGIFKLKTWKFIFWYVFGKVIWYFFALFLLKI